MLNFAPRFTRMIEVREAIDHEYVDATEITVDAANIIALAARHRGISPTELAARILNMAAVENMIDAILDDGA